MQKRSLFLKKYLIIFFTLLLFSLQAQKVFSNYPFLFDQFSVHRNALNPAAYLSEKAIAQTGYNGFNQLSNKLSSFYLNIRINMKGDSALYHHGIGCFITADQEGEFLSRQKWHLQYAYAMRLAERTYLHTGTSLGMVHNALKANEVVGSEGISRFDMDLGVWLRHKNLALGISGNQLPNTSIRFFNGTYTLKRYLQLYSSFRYNLGRRTTGSSEFLYRTGNEQWNKISGGTSILYNNLIYIGLFYKLKNGLSPQIGVHNIPLTGKSLLGFRFSYKVPVGVDLLSNTANLELMAEIKLR